MVPQMLQYVDLQIIITHLALVYEYLYVMFMMQYEFRKTEACEIK